MDDLHFDHKIDQNKHIDHYLFYLLLCGSFDCVPTTLLTYDLYGKS
jgi:hypothetical protein